jgi:phosphoglycolate phosphatase-like HAD superfamily hydrolase
MIRAVIFDLDGTLVDSAPDLVAALNRVRLDEGLPPKPYEELRTASAYGAAGLIGRGLPPANEEVTERWKQQFLQYYEDNIYRESQMFDGVSGLVEWLASQAIPWGVVTNKLERFTLPLLKQANLLGSAGCVVCGDTLDTVKPHPAPV